MPEPMDTIEALGLTVESVFVPWSQSRNFKPNGKMNDRSLNWRITLKSFGRDILTTDYSAGIAHCPSYTQSFKPTLMEAEKIARETEDGRHATGFRKAIMPKPESVIHSLVMDSDCLDYASFEEWADNIGFDPDSRKAETIYKACLELALRMRSGLGNAALERLREAFQDY
jgi:hypothetical protein